MSLKIFGNEAPAATGSKSFSDDIVGRLRSGYQANKRPVSLPEWRVTTGDPSVADAVRSLMGGDPASEWDATGEDNLEVFTKADSVGVILEGPKALRQKMVLWGRNGAIYMSDGETIFYPDERRGEPDPDAGKTMQERKALSKENGAVPQVEVYFRLEDDPELGIFKFQSGSWSLVNDLAFHDVDGQLEEIDGPAAASLSLELVEFVAKNGPMAGKTVSFRKPVLTVKGPAQGKAPF